MKEIKDKKIYKVEFYDSTDPVYYYRKPGKTKDLYKALQEYKGCIIVGEECAVEFLELIIVITKDYIQRNSLIDVYLSRLDDALCPGRLVDLYIIEGDDNVLKIALRPVRSFES